MFAFRCSPCWATLGPSAFELRNLQKILPLASRRPAVVYAECALGLKRPVVERCWLIE